MGAPQYEQAGADIAGGGTAGNLAVWTTGSTLGNSGVTDNGTTVSFVSRNLSSTAAQAWTLASSTSALNIASGLLNLDTTNARVGIGTTAPGAKLQVNAAASSSAIFAVGSSGAGTSYGITIQAGTNSSDRSFGVYDATFTLPYLNVRGDGNVGIGTASPAARLHSVAADGTYQLALTGTTKGIRFQTTAAQSQIDGVDNTLVGSYQPLAINGSTLGFLIAGATKAGINGASQFYVSTSGTAAAPVICESTGVSGMYFPSATTLAFSTNGTERARIDSSGNVGIGVAPSAWNSAFRVIDMRTHALFNYNSGNDANAYWSVNTYTDAGGNVLYKATAAASQYAQSAGAHIWYRAVSGTAGAGCSLLESARIDSAGNIYGTSGTTGMTNGFFYIPAAAGTPTGTPTAISGRVPMYYDTTNNKFYVYNGAWKAVTLA